MKKLIYKIQIILAGAIIFCSCTQLESEDYSNIDPGFFPVNDEDATALVTACYNPFSASWYDGYWSTAQGGFQVMSEMATDMMDCQWGANPWGPPVTFTWHANWAPVTNFYGRYQHISRITLAINRLETLEMRNKTLQERLIAECKALRGWLAYMLYDLYGPVPIATPEQLQKPLEDTQIPRATEEEMQKFIENNLNEALSANVLPLRATGSSYGRVSAALCHTVLMKHYMLTKQWDKAIAEGRELQKTEYGFGLMDGYTDIFTLENEGNKEIIHAATASLSVNSTLWLAHVLPGSYPTKNPAIQKWNGYRMIWKYYHTFDPADKRLDAICAAYSGTDGVLYNESNPASNLAKGAIPIKVGEDPGSTGEASGVDWIIYRYADVLTLLGEAIVRNGNAVTQEAVDLLSSIRPRTGLRNYTMADFPTAQAYLDVVLEERGHEFFCEGVRRSDLIRHGKYQAAAEFKGYGDTYRPGVFERWPLPQSAIDEGKGVIVQNPGY
ncbi:MAG: RagB/SusD family nutrient uptake outer membrane protein [Tannerella sp.]|jgi:hypothetical protein|nr:RagB/SusD family nutrient uptake outer membrane protein [Tannerella sp.]